MQTAHKYAQDTFGTLMRCVFIFYRTVNLELRGNISAVGRYQDRNSIYCLSYTLYHAVCLFVNSPDTFLCRKS